jgi:acyl-CoA thioesterase FadM
LAAYLDQSEWADRDSWRLWVDAWGESVHSGLVRDTLGRFDIGWRAVLAEVLSDGVRQGRWACADPQDTAARLVAVIDGIGLHTTVHGEDVPPGRAAAWARRIAELELGVTLPAPPPPVVVESAPVHMTRIEVRARDLDAAGHVDPAALFAFLEEARASWLGPRLPDAVVTHVAVGYRRPLGRARLTVTCTLDAAGRASFRTRVTVADEEGVAVEAATTLEVPGRALTPAERDELAR